MGNGKPGTRRQHEDREERDGLEEAVEATADPADSPDLRWLNLRWFKCMMV